MCSLTLIALSLSSARHMVNIAALCMSLCGEYVRNIMNMDIVEKCSVFLSGSRGVGLAYEKE
jgi:hypothetical protein